MSAAAALLQGISAQEEAPKKAKRGKRYYRGNRWTGNQEAQPATLTEPQGSTQSSSRKNPPRKAGANRHSLPAQLTANLPTDLTQLTQPTPSTSTPQPKRKPNGWSKPRKRKVAFAAEDLPFFDDSNMPGYVLPHMRPKAKGLSRPTPVAVSNNSQVVIAIPQTPRTFTHVPPHLRGRGSGSGLHKAQPSPPRDATKAKADSPSSAGVGAFNDNGVALPIAHPVGPVANWNFSTVPALGPTPPPSDEKRPQHASHPQTHNTKWPKITKQESPERKRGGWPKKEPRRNRIEWEVLDFELVHQGTSARKADSDCYNSDEDNAEKLVKNLFDWNGNWLPAPVEWEGRRSFREKDFAARMETWVIMSTNSIQAKGEITRDELSSGGEIAPRAWVPAEIDGQAPHTWWATHLRSDWVEEEDKGSRPWWVTYLKTNSAMLMLLDHPEPKMDTTDEGYMVHRRDHGSDGRTKEYFARSHRRQEELKKARKDAQGLKIAAHATFNAVQAMPNRYQPKANIYIRMVHHSDLPQIRTIYNYYVENTLYVPETRPLTQEMFSNRVNEMLSNRLFYIVAVEKGNERSPGGLRNRDEWRRNPNEKIMGFAFADDMLDIGSALRYAAEVEVYVHPEHQNKGIGGALLDRTVFLVDPEYNSRGGYEWHIGDISAFTGAPPDFNYVNSGGARTISNVICNLHYCADDVARMNVVGSMLENFGFEKAGVYKDIGVKRNEFVSLASYLRKTGQVIDPKSAL